jgi:DNA polymerase-3 subunit delta'
VPGFDAIIDQERPVRILTALLSHGTLPHALLFTGIEGVGKQVAAIALAMVCNCMQSHSGGTSNLLKLKQNLVDHSNDPNFSVGPCGSCKSCSKIKAGNHPDIIPIKPDGPIIKIAQVRALCNTLAMKPYEAKSRVVIIHDAQTMNPAAGNALLKILEEPPDRTILILIATQAQDLLPTIVSRCQQIRFNPISRKTLEVLLVEEHGLHPDDARAIAAMANGSFSRATAMYRTNWISRRNWIMAELKVLSSRPISHILAFAEQLSKEKETLPETLEVMKSWLRDLVMAKYNPAKILNQDIDADIQLASQDMNVTSLLSKIDLVQTTQNSIQANTNVRLLLEVMLMKLARNG